MKVKAYYCTCVEIEVDDKFNRLATDDDFVCSDEGEQMMDELYDKVKAQCPEYHGMHGVYNEDDEALLEY